MLWQRDLSPGLDVKAGCGVPRVGSRNALISAIDCVAFWCSGAGASLCLLLVFDLIGLVSIGLHSEIPSVAMAGVSTNERRKTKTLCRPRTWKGVIG